MVVISMLGLDSCEPAILCEGLRCKCDEMRINVEEEDEEQDEHYEDVMNEFREFVGVSCVRSVKCD